MNILAKIAEFVKLHKRDLFLGICMILIAYIGYGIGRVNTHKTPEESAANIYKAESSKELPPPVKIAPKPKDSRVVASKSSTSKKYHFTWCPGAKKIKEANKLWFPTETDAQKAGYTLAGNCN